MTHLLSTERVVHGSAAPGEWLLVLHGIYGAGRNWSTVARKVVADRPRLGALLVDLREHGGSRGFAPPHTIEAAAADLLALEEGGGTAATMLLGHSFGGKVALERLRQDSSGIRQVWVIDSTPTARSPSGSAWEMLERLRELPGPFSSRGELVEALEHRGLATPTAHWMATNLEREGNALTWRFDLDAMESLLRDFFARDLWEVVEAPPEGVEVHVVRASESSVLSPEDVARLEKAQRATGRVRLHTVAGGHWLNADNPDALVELLEAHL